MSLNLTRKIKKKMKSKAIEYIKECKESLSKNKELGRPTILIISMIFNEIVQKVRQDLESCYEVVGKEIDIQNKKITKNNLYEKVKVEN